MLAVKIKHQIIPLAALPIIEANNNDDNTNNTDNYNLPITKKFNLAETDNYVKLYPLALALAEC